MRWVRSGVYSPEWELYRDPRIPDVDRRMLTETIRVFDKVRELHGDAIFINSGRRSPEHQLELLESNLRAAATSPHVYGVALDVNVPAGKTDEYLVALIFGAAEILGYDSPRVGWRVYRGAEASSTFVHFDFAFLLPDSLVKTLPEKAQKAWPIRGLTW